MPRTSPTPTSVIDSEQRQPQGWRTGRYLRLAPVFAQWCDYHACQNGRGGIQVARACQFDGRRTDLIGASDPHLTPPESLQVHTIVNHPTPSSGRRECRTLSPGGESIRDRSGDHRLDIRCGHRAHSLPHSGRSPEGVRNLQQQCQRHETRPSIPQFPTSSGHQGKEGDQARSQSFQVFGIQLGNAILTLAKMALLPSDTAYMRFHALSNSTQSSRCRPFLHSGLMTEDSFTSFARLWKFLVEHGIKILNKVGSLCPFICVERSLQPS